VNFGLLFAAGYLDSPQFMFCSDSPNEEWQYEYEGYQEYWLTGDTVGNHTQVFSSYMYDPNPDKEGPPYDDAAAPPEAPRVSMMHANHVLGLDYLGRKKKYFAHTRIGVGWNVVRGDTSVDFERSEEVAELARTFVGNSKWGRFLLARDVLRDGGD
jgi:hypothetical protein